MRIGTVGIGRDAGFELAGLSQRRNVDETLSQLKKLVESLWKRSIDVVLTLDRR